MSSAPVLSPSDIAQSILKDTSQKLARGMVPLAEISPNGSVCSNGQSIAAATISNGISVQWPCDGILVGIRATTRDGLPASMAGCLLRVQVNSNEDLYPNAAGNGSGYIPFAQVSGVSSSFGRYLVRRTFSQTTYWTFYLNNTTAGTLVCDVSFDYINTTRPTQ
jgi:hypothetical protein